MSDIKMSDDNILYCLQTISSFEPDDIECDDFEIAVNDDQFAQMSIVRSVELGVDLIGKLTEQNKMLREALALVVDKLPIYQNIQGGGYAITLSIDDVNIIKESLKISEL